MSAGNSASMSRDQLCPRQWFIHNGSYVDLISKSLYRVRQGSIITAR